MASIRDIAKMAEVSPASVSRILNHDPKFKINNETRKRVIDIANRLNYTKRAPGKNKFKRKEISIGVILRHNDKDQISDPYFMNLYAGLNEEAKKWNIKLDFPFKMNDVEKDWNCISNYDAVLIEGQLTDNSLNKIKLLNRNIILLDVNSTISGWNIVKNDFDEQTIYILDYLYDLGHRNIAYIGGPAKTLNLEGRCVQTQDDIRSQTYIKWMKLHDLDKYINNFITEWSSEAGLENGEKALELSNPPTAILAGSDPIAIGVYKALNNHNVKIPNDISIASFDDVDITKFLTPSLSSVYFNSKEMGKSAIRLAKSLILESTDSKFTLICQSKFKIRDSITAIKKRLLKFNNVIPRFWIYY